MDVEATLFQARYLVRANERILEKAAELTDAQLRDPASLDHGTVFETLLHLAIVDWGWRDFLAGNDDDDSYPDGWPPGDLATLTAFWDREHARLVSHVEALDERTLEQPFTW